MKTSLTQEQYEDFIEKIQRPYWGQLRYLAGVYGVKEGTLRQIKRRYHLELKNQLLKDLEI